MSRKKVHGVREMCDIMDHKEADTVSAPGDNMNRATRMTLHVMLFKRNPS